METVDLVSKLVSVGTLGIVLYLFKQYRDDKLAQDKTQADTITKKDDALKEINKDLLDAYKENTRANVIQSEALKTLSANVQKNTEVMITFTEKFANALKDK